MLFVGERAGGTSLYTRECSVVPELEAVDWTRKTVITIWPKTRLASRIAFTASLLIVAAKVKFRAINTLTISLI